MQAYHVYKTTTGICKCRSCTDPALDFTLDSDSPTPLMSDCRAILAVSPVLAWTCRDLLAAHTLVVCYAGHGWESKTLEHGHDGLASWLRGLWCDDYRRRADARMRQPVGRCAAGVRMLLRYRASVLHIMSRRQGLLSGRDRLWILTRLLLYMHRYSRNLTTYLQDTHVCPKLKAMLEHSTYTCNTWEQRHRLRGTMCHIKIACLIDTI